MIAEPAAETRQGRFDRGMEVLTRVDGEGGQRVIDALNATFVAEQVLGERDLLPVRTR